MHCWSCVTYARCSLAACQVLTLYEYYMQFKILQPVFFWSNNFSKCSFISLHLLSGLFNCWDSWLYGTWSAVEEGVWNGVRLVVPGCNHVWDAYRLSSLLLWWSKDHMPQGCTKLWFSIIFLEFFIFAKSSIFLFFFQIINWKTCLKFPEEPKISSEAKDLICHLLCDVETRLGTRGVEELKVNFPPIITAFNIHIRQSCRNIFSCRTLSINRIV